LKEPENKYNRQTHKEVVQMKRRIIVIGIALLFNAVLAGCAGNKDLIAKASTNSRQDVFQEVTNNQGITGKSVLKLEFPVKNFKSRFVNSYNKHTDPQYTVVLNIDGQTTVLSDDPVLEDLPGNFKENSEVGTGWKYNFKKTLALQPGKHRVSIAIPVSDVIIEKEIDLKEGENTLKLFPTYLAPISRYPNFPRFSLGLRDITATLNNQNI
jgi:hypothetical protein